jgi:hypothetical protein
MHVVASRSRETDKYVVSGEAGSSTSGEAGGPTSSTGTEGAGGSTNGEASGPTSNASSKEAKVQRESTLRI